MHNANLKNALRLAASAILLYYSHFLICVAFLIPLAISHILINGKSLKTKQNIQLLFAIVLFLLATVPYTVIYRSWERPDMPHVISIFNHFKILPWYLRESITTGLAPWSIVVMAILLIVTRSVEPKKNAFIKACLFILFGYIVLIGLSARQNIPSNPAILPLAEIRYLVACFPLTTIIAGIGFQWIHRRNMILAIILALLVSSTNVAYALPWRNFRYSFPHALIYSPLCEYINEIHHHHITSIEVVSEYLKNNLKKDDTYFAWPEGRCLPISFYLGSKLINSCELDTNTYIGHFRAKALSPFLLMNDNFPDWLIFFGAGPNREEYLDYFSRPINTNGLKSDHDYELVANLPVYWDYGNHPEIFWHSFGSVTNVAPYNHVFIFHKVPENTNDWLRHFPQIINGSNTFCSTPSLADKAFSKLYNIYIQDTTMVNNIYSHERLDEYFRSYLDWLIANNRMTKAAAIAETISKLEPTTTSSCLLRARVLIGEGHYDSVLEVASTLTQLNRHDSVEVHNGNIPIDYQDLDLLFQYARQHSNPEMEYYSCLIIYGAYKSNPIKMLSRYNPHELSQDFSVLVANLYQKKQLRAADSVCQTLRTFCPNNDYSDYLSAKIKLELGRYDECLALCNSLMRKTPRIPMDLPYLISADAYVKKHDKHSAQNVLKDGLLKASSSKMRNEFESALKQISMN